MLLLSALHKRGFERLRLSAGISPSGLHWRYEIAPVASFNPDGLTVKDKLYARGAAGSTGKVLKQLRRKRLRTSFRNAFLRLPRWAGARTTLTLGRFEHVLTLTAPEGLVVMYGEYHNLASDGIGVLRAKHRVEVPLPPPVTDAGAREL